jgi:SAM-dependent methyltransferase
MAVLFTVTSFVAAFLLFSIQPLVARLMLPPLGGSPMVWNTAMVFFQAVLLGGYLYSHWLGQRIEIARRPFLTLHCLLLLIPLAFLPIALPQNTAPPATTTPILWLLGVLTLCAGTPFALISTCSPFLQRTFAFTGHKDAHDPYFLYSASNAGSLSALLAYPIFIEPNLGLQEQSRLWMFGYMGLVVLLWTCAFVVMRKNQAAATTPAPETPAIIAVETAEPPTAKSPTENEASISWPRRLRWVMLAFVPSSLMLSLTNYLSSDIAAIPLLWILPLSLYLLSFMVVFAKRQPVPLFVWVRGLAILVLPLVIAMSAHASEPLGLLVPLHCGIFFMAAVVCHGTMARDRPSARHLTEFYGWMAFGGVLGGACNSLLAPIIFKEVWEYPLTVALVCLMLPRELLLDKESDKQAPYRLSPLDVIGPLILTALCWMLVEGMQKIGMTTGPQVIAIMFGVPAFASFVWSRRPLRFALAVLGILWCGQFYRAGQAAEVLAKQRSFFGVHRVVLSEDKKFHLLSHGSTIHGIQMPSNPAKPLAYYAEMGPVGDIMRTRAGKTNLRVADVGLGAGAMAAYAQPGQNWALYEIDPHVAEIASDPKLFTYLHDAKQRGARIDMILGDARLKLKNAPDHSFDVIVLDAYSSDTIPVHLLTKEALALYEQKLAPGGIIAWHLSNNWFDLEPIVGRLAQESGWYGRARFFAPNEDDKKGKLSAAEIKELAKKKTEREGINPSQWAALARSEADLGDLRSNRKWKPIRVETTLWTDDRSSLWPLLVKHFRR